MINPIAYADTAGVKLAIEQSFVDYALMCVACAGGQIHRDPALTWMHYRLRLAYCNGVLQTHLAEHEVEEAIAAQVPRYRDSHGRMLWWVTPSSQPASLGPLLARHYFDLAWTDIGMAADLARIPASVPTPAALTIETVRDLATLHTWIDTYGAGFEMSDGVLDACRTLFTVLPPDQHPIDAFFLARLAGEPVATSVLYGTAGVAGIYEVCTLESARGQGIGAAVTLAALHAGRALGYQVATIHASPMGEPVYARLGFVRHCTLDAYMLTP